MNIERQIAFDVRGSWQARALAASKADAMGGIVLSVIAHNYDEQLLPLLRIVFPGFDGIKAPFFCSPARISRRGRVYCEMVAPDGESVRNEIIFKNETAMNKAFRDLADRLKLSDADRLDMFAAVKRWIICDYRLDPNTGEKERAA